MILLQLMAVIQRFSLVFIFLNSLLATTPDEQDFLNILFIWICFATFITALQNKHGPQRMLLRALLIFPLFIYAGPISQAFFLTFLCVFAAYFVSRQLDINYNRMWMEIRQGLIIIPVIFSLSLATFQMETFVEVVSKYIIVYFVLSVTLLSILRQDKYNPTSPASSISLALPITIITASFALTAGQAKFGSVNQLALLYLLIFIIGYTAFRIFHATRSIGQCTDSFEEKREFIPAEERKYF